MIISSTVLGAIYMKIKHNDLQQVSYILKRENKQT